MGDYTNHNKKIGTCGIAYYATLPMLEKYAKHNNDPEVNHYINPAKDCLFAFPFPEYDGKKIGEISQFHADEEAPPTFIHLPPDTETHHQHIVHHVHPRGAEGINLFIDCPYTSKPEQKSRNFKPESLIFKIMYQGYTDGKLWVHVECVYCRKLQALTKEEAQKAYEYLLLRCEQLQKQSDYEKWRYPTTGNWEYYLKEKERTAEIAARLIATYDNH